MKLADYLRPDLVVTDLEPEAPEEVFGRLVDPLVRAGVVEEAEPVVAALLSRERVLSTGIGQGIAVPHAICAELDATIVVVGVSRTGIDFHAIDDAPVHLFFVLLSPPDRTNHHIKLLARIARLLRDPRLAEDLRRARSPREVIETVEAFERRHV